MLYIIRDPWRVYLNLLSQGLLACRNQVKLILIDHHFRDTFYREFPLYRIRHLYDNHSIILTNLQWVERESYIANRSRLNKQVLCLA